MFILILFLSCSRDDRFINIYTDLPEAVILADQYNRQNTGYTAKVIFSNQQEEDKEIPAADLILNRNLHTPAYMAGFENLDHLREEEYIKYTYPAVLLACQYNTELKLIPLSLDLPVLLEKAPLVSGEGKTADWEELSRKAEEFNSLQDEALTRAGFSPLWSNVFLISFLLDSATDFQSLFEDPQVTYGAATGNLKGWIRDYNHDLPAILGFNEKYMYIPDYRLLTEGRIGFTVKNLSETMLLPDEIRKNLSFRYFAPRRKLLVTSLVSAGMPLNAQNREGAESFLLWMMQKHIWRDYYTEVIRNRDQIFAFGGISANREVNEEILTGIYPDLKEFVPYPGEFARIPQLVSQWDKVKEQVLLPHIREVLTKEAPPESLRNEYQQWLLLNPDPLMP